MKVSTTAMGKEHEEAMVRLFEWDNARRSKSSGASFHDPVDVTSENLIIECEATDGISYRFKRSFWDEIKEKVHSGKLGVAAIRFRDKTYGKHVDLIVMDANDVSELLEELEAHRREALERG